MTVPRLMPITVEPLPGEALDSWLDALAARLDTPLGHMIGRLGLGRDHANGLRSSHAGIWTTLLRPEEADYLAAAAGLKVDVLHAMTLARWHGRAIHLDLQRREVDRKTLWGRPRGSRFCPACLADTNGRWQLTWRLAWSFACMTHRTLLVDSCAACDHIPRTLPHPRQVVPVLGACDTHLPDPGRRGVLCAYPLSTVDVCALELDSPLLATQKLLNDLLDGSAHRTAVFAGVYGTRPIALRQAFGDLRALGGRIMATPTDMDVTPWAPAELISRRDVYLRSPLTTSGRRTTPLAKPGWMAPIDAATTGIALTLAAQMLTAPTIAQARDHIAWLMRQLTANEKGTALTEIKKWSTDISPALCDVLLGAAPNHLARRADRLHARSTLNQPRTARTRHQVDPQARAAQIPVLLWSRWALQLIPRDFRQPRLTRLRRALSASLMQVGHKISLPQALSLLSVTTTTAKAVTSTLTRVFAHQAGTEILRALTQLADQLDAAGSPIDYTRRRNVFGQRPEFIAPEEWAAIQQSTDYPHGMTPSIHQAQRWLHELLTGNPIETAHPDIAAPHKIWPQSHLRFRFGMHPAEVAALNTVAGNLLTDAHIDEPLTWEPSLTHTQSAELKLPGHHPDELEPGLVHGLVHAGCLRPADLAQRLATTPAHIRYILDAYPLNRRADDDRNGRRYRWASSYEEGHPISQIAREDSVSPSTVSQELHQLGITIRPCHPLRRFDHLTSEVTSCYRDGQTLAEISAATGLNTSTARNILIRADQPRRPSGPRRPNPT